MDNPHVLPAALPVPPLLLAHLIVATPMVLHPVWYAAVRDG